MDAQTNQPEKTRFFGNGSKQFSPKQPNRRDMTDQNRSCGMQMVVTGSDIHQNGDIKAGCNIFALQCTCQLQ